MLEGIFSLIHMLCKIFSFLHCISIGCFSKNFEASSDGLVVKVWCAPLWQPGFGSCVQNQTTCLSLHAVVAARIEVLEGLTTGIYNYVLGLWGEKRVKREEDWQQMLAQGKLS